MKTSCHFWRNPTGFQKQWLHLFSLTDKIMLFTLVISIILEVVADKGDFFTQKRRKGRDWARGLHNPCIFYSENYSVLMLPFTFTWTSDPYVLIFQRFPTTSSWTRDTCDSSKNPWDIQTQSKSSMDWGWQNLTLHVLHPIRYDGAHPWLVPPFWLTKYPMNFYPLGPSQFDWWIPQNYADRRHLNYKDRIGILSNSNSWKVIFIYSLLWISMK